MKKLRIILGLFLLVVANTIWAQSNYTGHVTLLRKNATMISAGIGSLTPGTDGKDLGFGNTINLNLGIYQSLWQKNNAGFGLHAFGEYSFGNGSIKNFAAFPIAGYTSSVENPANPKFSGFSVGAGPQVNFGLGDKVMISPIVDFAYVNQKLDAYSVIQNYNSGGTSKSISLYSQPEIKTSGLGIIPRIRFQYFFSKNIGVWLEGNYAVLPKINTTTSTFTPNGNPVQNGQYNIDQIVSGIQNPKEIAVNNSGIGFGGGIVIGISGGKGWNGKTEENTTQTNPEPTKNTEIETLNSSGEIFTSTPVKKENIEKQSCVKILSPSNGSNQNINENVKILLNNEDIKQSIADVKIYKISNDKNFWNKPENRKDLFDNNNTVFLSSKFQKESETTGFKPISVDAKQSGAVLESSIDKGKLTEGAYKMVVISNCGVATSNFTVSSSALTTISLTTACKEKFGDYSYVFVVKNTGTNPINITSIPNFISSTGTVTGLTISPALPIVIPAGGTQNFTGSFSYAGTYTGSIVAQVFGHQVGNTALQSMDSEPGEVKSCICNFCDKVLEFDSNQSPNATYSATSNSLSIHQDWWNMNTSAVTVVGAKAEIVSFERQVSDECMKCDKDSNQWGNFISGHSGTTNGSFGNANDSVPGSTHHTLYFTNSNSYSFDTNISLPPLSTLACCCEKIKLKIRYTYIFKDKNGECKMCSAVFEYYYQRGQCRSNPTGPQNPTGLSTNANDLLNQKK